MKKLYSVHYENDSSGLGIAYISPEHSEYLEEMSYNGVLLSEVQTEDEGRFVLDVWLDDETGKFQIQAKFEYLGWQEVEI